MTALYGCSRSVLFGLAALSFVGGVTLLGDGRARAAAGCS